MKENEIKVIMYGKTSRGSSKAFCKDNIQNNDEEIEKLWDEFEDVLFVEEESGTLVLSSDWNGFEAGTDREAIWHWFDKQHSKGINWLLNGRETE